MKYRAFALRSTKELLRDPTTYIFGFGFPIVITFMMWMLTHSIEGMPRQFAISSLVPAMTIFGLSFISMFAAMQLSGDRDSSFLMRSFTAPLKASDFILGYSLPLLTVAFIQSISCFALGAVLGANFSFVNYLWAFVSLIPSALLYIGLGLVMGSLFGYKQVGPLSSLLINISAWLSGTWFDLSQVGGVFSDICYVLPFAHGVDMTRAAAAGDIAGMLPHLWVVLAYGVVAFAAAILLFKRKMRDN